MKRDLRVLAAAGVLSLALTAADAALAQQQGGILRMPHFDSPASMSLLEESTVAVTRPMMPVFNNLVMFKQDVPQNSLRSIVPDLATSWEWNEEGTELTMPTASSTARASKTSGWRDRLAQTAIEPARRFCFFLSERPANGP